MTSQRYNRCRVYYIECICYQDTSPLGTLTLTNSKVCQQFIWVIIYYKGWVENNWGHEYGSHPRRSCKGGGMSVIKVLVIECNIVGTC